MNAKKQNTNWNLILDLWDTHLNNPKYANDLSEIKINSKKYQTAEVIIVSHSFILNNLKKLLTIDPSLYGEINETKIGLEEFTKNTISKKFALPKKPNQFQKRRIVQEDEFPINDKEHFHGSTENIEFIEEANTDQGENISKLLPFSQKADSSQKQDNSQKNSSSLFSYKTILKVVAVALPLLLLTYVVKNTFMNTTMKVQKQKKTISKKKRGTVNKKRTTSSRKKNTLKKSTSFKKKVNRKPKTVAKKQISKKSKKRRKNLFEQRTRKMPASLSSNEDEYDEKKETSNNDPYEQELIKDQEDDDRPIVDESEFSEEAKSVENEEMIDEGTIEEPNYQDKEVYDDEMPEQIEAPDTNYMQ